MALTTANRTGVTKVCVCIVTKYRLRAGSSKVPVQGVGRGGVDVAVTEQRDEDQDGGERRICGGRTSPNTWHNQLG